jgi:hypothetical protein
MRPLTKTFTLRKDALEWARLMEVKADRRDLPEDTKVLQTITLGDLVRRYRDEVTVLKKGRETTATGSTADLGDSPMVLG